MITLKEGDLLRVEATFQHRGKAFERAEMYATIGIQNAWFNEVFSSGKIRVPGIKDDQEWATYKFPVDIPIGKVGGLGGARAGPIYEVYAKLTNLPGIGTDLEWYGPENDIELVEPSAEEAKFQNLQVSYAKA